MIYNKIVTWTAFAILLTCAAPVGFFPRIEFMAIISINLVFESKDDIASKARYGFHHHSAMAVLCTSADPTQTKHVGSILFGF